ncbi:hypothetical protein ACS0TY_024642 [Phlomoides rotata]
MKEYLSSYSVCPSESRSGVLGELYLIDYLNSIKCYGLPNHRLVLKVGVPIMSIRNIDPKSGLCNGTRCWGDWFVLINLKFIDFMSVWCTHV